MKKIQSNKKQMINFKHIKQLNKIMYKNSKNVIYTEAIRRYNENNQDWLNLNLGG